MLDWKNLTLRQRTSACLFACFAALLLAVAGGSVLGTARPLDGVRGMFAGMAVSAFMLAVLLNPHAVRGDARAIQWSATPMPCRALFACALVALVLRGVLGAVTVT